ncbi:MAG: hypothetical protein QOE23_3765 [Pseudonocardiales bacterium]|jgi:hypothetical protein|nr:hypothetical protein [Pseudonocardiales bacterium]
MLTYTRFPAAEQVPAAFGAVPAGLVAPSALRNSDITSAHMTKVFGQVRPPRKIPL